jgi:uncharacterized protein involved in exopolysaccharide biosynthesis
MIFKHVIELLRYYRLLAVAVVLCATLAAAGTSMLRLKLSPKYTATAKVAVLPTEAEYTFGRESGSGPRATARGLTSTYMEYLKSRPVVEAALAKVEAAAGPSAEPVEVSAPVALVKRGIGFARRIYRTLDSGKYVPSTEHGRKTKKLMDAIELHKVVDSYILSIQVSLDDPAASAAAANALAEAYVDRVSEQLAISAGEIGGFLQQQIAERETELTSLLAEEEQLKRGLGVSSIDEERQHLLGQLETARQKLLDAQDEESSAGAALGALQRVDIAQSGRSLRELSQERSEAEGRSQAARRSMQLRQGNVDEIERQLAALRGKEEPLLEVYRQMDQTKSELAELQKRMLSTNLTRSSAMAQVRVVDPAVPPVYASSPRVVRNTAAGFAAGIVLALFCVFLIDTVSGTVKTSADLARVVGARNLSALSSSMVRKATDPSGPLTNGKRRFLEDVGSELERGLTVLRAFEASSIQVTGFLPPVRLSETALAIGTALASTDRRVACTVPDYRISGETTRMLGAGGQEEADADDFDPDEAERPPVWATNGRRRPIRLQCLQPVSADLHLAEAARRSEVLLCVVPAGQVQEQDLEEFHQRASAVGLSALCFVLLNG